MRDDLAEAISLAPSHVRDEIMSSCSRSLELVDSNLPSDEVVVRISSAAPSQGGRVNSLLVLTDRRLLFVAPAPQALGWRLPGITRAQAYAGYFFVHADGGEYSLGLEKDWGSTFEGYVAEAVALAVLRGQ
jgi:hypothetical protein